MLPLISTIAGSRRGLQTGTTSEVQCDVANLHDEVDDFIVAMTADLVPVSRGSSSHQ